MNPLSQETADLMVPQARTPQPTSPAPNRELPPILLQIPQVVAASAPPAYTPPVADVQTSPEPPVHYGLDLAPPPPPPEVDVAAPRVTTASASDAPAGGIQPKYALAAVIAIVGLLSAFLWTNFRGEPAVPEMAAPAWHATPADEHAQHAPHHSHEEPSGRSIETDASAPTQGIAVGTPIHTAHHESPPSQTSGESQGTDEPRVTGALPAYPKTSTPQGPEFEARTGIPASEPRDAGQNSQGEPRRAQPSQDTPRYPRQHGAEQSQPFEQRQPDVAHARLDGTIVKPNLRASDDRTRSSFH